MNVIVSNIKWIMLVSGALTCTMVYAAISPHEALRSTFGESMEGPVAEVVVRNWGALIALVGAMLIYGSTRPAVRGLCLVVAATSKLVFIALVLLQGSRFLGQQAGVAVVVDSFMILIFVAYLLAKPQASAAHA